MKAGRPGRHVLHVASDASAYRIQNTISAYRIQNTISAYRIQNTISAYRIQNTISAYRIQNTISAYRIQNTISAYRIQNTISAYRIQNTISAYRIQNTISAYRIQNTISAYRIKNTISAYRVQNTISAYRIQNTISACRIQNTISAYRIQNTIGAYRIQNTISAYRVQNTISAYRIQNTISVYRVQNTISACRIQNTISAYRVQNTISAYREQNTISAYRIQNTINACRIQNTISAYRIQNTISAYRIQNTISAYRVQNTISAYRIQNTISAYRIQNTFIHPSCRDNCRSTSPEDSDSDSESRFDLSLMASMASPTVTGPVCRGYAQITSFLVVGIIFGHVLWTQIHPSIDPKFLDCREASTPARKAKEQAEAIRMKIANQHFRLGLLNSNDTGEQQASFGRPEENDDHFLFIGIMTARKYLDTRAFASSQTWVPRVPGKVVYFLGEGEEYRGDLNVIQLKGIKENDYPPQKKSFAMVHYMAEHFAKDYEWLIRADDDVYMRVDELVKFLKSINTTTPRYIGQPGFGKAIEEGKLGLAGAFCMGGPGVIMSRDVVLGVAPGLRDCLGVTVTGHEDTELGRCITINTGVQCSTNYEMKELFYQNYAELNLPNSSFKKELGKDELRAINLHPVKEPSYMFRLDNFFNNATLQKLEAKTRALRHEMLAMNYLLGDSPLETQKGLDGRAPKGLLDSAAPIPEEDQQIHKEFFEEASVRRGAPEINLEEIRLLPDKPSIFHNSDKAWEFIRYKTLHSTNFETGKLQFPMDIKRRAALFLDMTKHLRQLPEFRRSAPILANITYQRLTSNRGAETIVYLRKRFRERKYLQPLYMRKPLEHSFVQFREADTMFDEEKGAEGKPIYMLMPLYQRSAIYRRFLEMYARVVTGYNGKVELRVVVFPDDRGEHKLISAFTYSMIGSHPDLDIRMTYMDEPFNRGKGLMTALADLPYNSLLLFMDVDMEFSSLFLHRVSKYTVMGKSTFFPIYFVHFNPESICYKADDCDQLLNSRADKVGLWRSFSYGIGAVYKRDLQRAGGFKTDIQGWGLEDVDFFEKCISLGLHVMRPSDPSMIHRYHPRECNTSLPLNQLIQCQDSGAAMLGSVKNLYHILDDVSNGEGVIS